MRQATPLLLTYLALEYIIPFVLNSYIDTEPLFRLPLDNKEAVDIFIISLIISALAIFFSAAMPVIGKKKKYPLKPINHNFLFSYLSISLVFTLFTFVFNLSQWRYSQIGISEQPTIAFIAFLQFFTVLVFLWILISDHKLLLSKKSNAMLIKFLLAASIIGGINGLGGALFAMFAIPLILAPKLTLPWIFRINVTNGRNKSSLKILSFILLPLIALLLTPMLINIGLYAKSGPNAKATNPISLYNTTSYLINRHSVHMSQALASIEDGYAINNLQIIQNSFLYRTNLLLGKPSEIERPLISSYSRKALLQFADFEGDINPRGGSSPGVLATFSMTFPPFFHLTFLFLFFLIVASFINYVLYSQPKLTWAGCLIICYFFLRIFLDSPADFFVPGPHMLALIVTIFLASRRKGEGHRL